MEFIYYDYRAGNKVRDELKEILGDYLIENKDDEGMYHTLEIPEDKLYNKVFTAFTLFDVMFSGGSRYLFIDNKGFKFRQR